MKTYYIKRILTTIIGLTAVFCGGSRLMAQTERTEPEPPATEAVQTAQPPETAAANTYSDGLSKAPKVVTNIEIIYPSTTEASNYTCVGDTILVKATADNITDLIVPTDPAEKLDWHGDKWRDPNDNGTTITRRFFTYHNEADAVTPRKQEFEFHIIQADGTDIPVKRDIFAKSCPPTTKAVSSDEATLPKNYYGKYNLGYCNFLFLFNNKSTRDKDIQFNVIATPKQYTKRFDAKTPNTDGLVEITYRMVPYCDADYTFEIRYNEGMRTRITSLGPFTRTVAPKDKTELALKPDNVSYCTDEEINFTLTLPEAYEKMLLQKAQNATDLPTLNQCFKWRSPEGTEVSLTNRNAATRTYTFTTTATGKYEDYGCQMSASLAYQDRATKPIIDTAFDVDYDLQIEPFTVHSAQGLSTTGIDDACEGNSFDLKKLIPTGSGMTIEGYSRNGTFTAGNNYTVPAQTETIWVKVKSPFYCEGMNPDQTFESQLTVNVTPKPEIKALSVGNDTLICEGEPLRLAAEINPAAKATVTWTKTQGGNTTAIDESELDHFTLHNDATITATASNTCPTVIHRSFVVQIGPKPYVQIKPNSAKGCPGTPVSLKGDGDGINGRYQLRDAQGHDLTPTTPELTNNGLDGYILKEKDDLILTYTAEKQTTATPINMKPDNLSCYSTAEANIIALPLPEVKIAYDGQDYGEGATLCVPRDETFSLTASGADRYTWTQDGAASSSDFNLPADASITVTGTNNATTCSASIKVQAIVSVEHAGRVKDRTVCRGEEACFEADALSNTTYTWNGPGSGTQSPAYKYCIRHVQPDDKGTYTLTAQRDVCTEKLDYHLDLYPYPDLTTIINNPVCEGKELTFNYLHGLTEADIQSAVLQAPDGHDVPGQSITNDCIIYRIPDITTTAAGRYTLTVTTTHNCTARDETDIIVGSHLTPAFGLESAYCEDDEATLSTPTTGNDYEYHWFTDNRKIGSDATLETVWQRTDNGNLYLEIRQTGCTDTAIQPLTVIPRPHLSHLPDTGLCAGGSIYLQAETDYIPDEVLWYFVGKNGIPVQEQPDASHPLRLPRQDVDDKMDGRYFVMVSNQGCGSTSDTMRLTVHPLPDLRIDGPTFICSDDTVTLIAFSQTPGSNRWKPTGETTDSIRVTQAGAYKVIRTSNHGCRDSLEIQLEARERPYFRLPDDTAFCRNFSFMIYGPEGMDEYLWNDGSDEKDHLVEEEGWYILTVTRNECPFTDSLFADETFCGQFHFPTAFTPNGNAVNDHWGAISIAKEEDMAEFDLMVFDRNGKKVFHGKRISDQWDGTYKGQLCPPGVYTYSFRALEKEEGIKYQANGTVTIVL